jgi:hypothetical protein
VIISHSELACYRACPRKHHLAYRERLATLVPAESLTRGTGVHRELAAIWSGDGAHLDELGAADSALVQGYMLHYSPVIPPDSINVRVNVPFRVELSDDVTVVGECDAVYTHGPSGRTVVVEHKTTASDITPGSAYWAEKKVSNPQVSIYLLAFPGAFVLYDVLRKSSLRPLREGKPNAETDAEYYARCLADIATRPERYYQRANILRYPEELIEARDDVLTWAAIMTHASRNPDSCFSFGRRCEYFDVCWNGLPIENDLTLVRREKNHTEEVTEKLEKLEANRG